MADRPGGQAAHRRLAGAAAGTGRLRRYAAICRGPETTAVLQAYERSNWEGLSELPSGAGALRSGAAGPARATAVVRLGAGDRRARGRRLLLGGGGAGACRRRRGAAPWRQGLARGPAGGRPPAPGNSPARAGWAQLAGAGGGRAARWVGAQPRRGPSGAGRAGASAFGWQAAAAAAGPARRGEGAGPAALAAGTCEQGSGNRADPGG